MKEPQSEINKNAEIYLYVAAFLYICIVKLRKECNLLEMSVG